MVPWALSIHETPAESACRRPGGGFECGGLRIWWNWQTRYFEVVVPQGVQVQVLLSAPTISGGYASVRPGILPNLLPNRTAKKHPRYLRISRGLYRESRNGKLWHVAKKNGRVRWRNLKTSDRNLAAEMIRGRSDAECQTGNHAIEVLSPDAATGDHFEGKARKARLPTDRQGASGDQKTPDQEGATRTLRQLLDEWLAGKAVAETTKKRIGFQVRMLAEHLDLNMPVAALDTGRLRRLQAGFRKDHKASTTNDLFAQVIRPALDLSVEMGWLPGNPADPIRPLRKESPRRLQPSWAEALELVSQAERIDARAGRILRFMLLFGVGQGEVRGLRGEHFDMAKGVVHMLRLKTRRHFDVPIYPHAREFVGKLEDEGVLRTGQVVFVWQNPRAALEGACKRLDMPRYSPRALRRSLIIHLIEEDIDIRQIARWQGHRDAKLILDTYGAYISPERTTAELKKLEKRTASKPGRAI